MNSRARSLTTAGLILVLAFLAGSLMAGLRGTGPKFGDPVDAAVLVPASSHVLGEPGSSDVTVVEFLDFQCPPCGQMHPVVEDARKKYAGEVTFVLRQYPIPTHAYARAAAAAAEAAANQGLLETMYRSLFATQDEWSDLDDEAKAQEFFRGLARDAGADLTRYDADATSPEVEATIGADVAAGGQLGVNGTPSFFVAGRPVTLTSDDDLAEAIDMALDGNLPD